MVRVDLFHSFVPQQWPGERAVPRGVDTGSELICSTALFPRSGQRRGQWPGGRPRRHSKDLKEGLRQAILSMGLMPFLLALCFLGGTTGASSEATSTVPVPELLLVCYGIQDTGTLNASEQQIS